jgi:hypothetical protein
MPDDPHEAGRSGSAVQWLSHRRLAFRCGSSRLSLTLAQLIASSCWLCPNCVYDMPFEPFRHVWPHVESVTCRSRVRVESPIRCLPAPGESTSATREQMPGVASRMSAPISCWSKPAHHRKQTVRAGVAPQDAFGARLARQGDWGRLARAGRPGPLRRAPLCAILPPTWVKVRRVDAPFASGRRVGVADRFRLSTISRGGKCVIKAAQRPPTRPSRPRTQTRVLLARLRPTTEGSTAFHRWSPEAIRFGSSYRDSSQEFEPAPIYRCDRPRAWISRSLSGPPLKPQRR